MKIYLILFGRRCNIGYIYYKIKVGEEFSIVEQKTLKAASIQPMNKIAKRWHDLYDIRGAKKENFSMHTFRKTAAWKYYVATNHNLIATMNFLNNSSPDVTKRYLRIDEEEMRDNYLKAFGETL